MIIVEQDKTYTVNYNNVGYIAIAVDKEEKSYAITAVIIGERKIILGVYKTEKRAREVLKEITERAKGWENLKMGQPSGICEFVYEMPKQ